MAGGITEAVVDDIKSRIELSDLISSYGVTVRTAGSAKKACCPFHNEKTPSFVINDAKGFYHCFGCGEAGDAIKFVQKMDGLTFVEAVKKLADRCAVSIETAEDPEAAKRKRLYALMAELAQFYRRCLLKTKEAQAAREYLKARDLGEDVQEAFLIGYAPQGTANILKWAGKYGYSVDELAAAGVVKPPEREGDTGYHRFGGRLMFTVKDKRGRVVAFSGRQLVASKNSGKYVNSPETAIFKKANVLFGFDRAAGNISKSVHREAIVCEGQIDTIRLHACGFPVAVASQGTAFTEAHVAILGKVADQVTLVFDDDAAGRKATIRTARLFLGSGIPVKVVTLPEGEDPDSFLRTRGAEEFARLLESSQSIIAYQTRVERAKERDAGSLDAISRVSKAVIETIARSSNAVLRAGMVNEAAKLLSLPALALADELEKFLSARSALPRRHVSKPHPEEEPREDFPADEESGGPPSADASGVSPGEDAGAAAAPPPRELAFCEFLLANEGDTTLDGMIGEFLPPEVFSHGFTRRFVDVWREQIVSGEDVIAPWGDGLDPRERGWFDGLLLGQSKSGASSLTATDIMQDFTRSLWADRLKRLRGSLPASGDGQSEIARVKISMDLRRLDSVKWHTVKDLIRQWMKEGV